MFNFSGDLHCDELIILFSDMILSLHLTYNGTANNKEHNVKKNITDGAKPPSIPNGNEAPKTRVNQAMSPREYEHEIPTTYSNNEVASLTNGSTVERPDCYVLNSSYSGSCSSSCSEEDRDEGCLDDWEAMADALTANKNQQTSDLKTETPGINCRYQGNSRAWSLNDIYRPRSLPSIPKQQYTRHLQVDSGSCFSRGEPSACPICCEDFDVTDSSFLPCPCGFRVCLFCHNKILEVDRRCPGCRKHYDNANGDTVLAVQTSHSWSKNTWF